MPSGSFCKNDRYMTEAKHDINLTTKPDSYSNR